MKHFKERMVSCINTVRASGERDKNWEVTTGSGNRLFLVILTHVVLVA